MHNNPVTTYLRSGFNKPEMSNSGGANGKTDTPSKTENADGKNRLKSPKMAAKFDKDKEDKPAVEPPVTGEEKPKDDSADTAATGTTDEKEKQDSTEDKAYSKKLRFTNDDDEATTHGVLSI